MIAMLAAPLPTRSDVVVLIYDGAIRADLRVSTSPSNLG